MFEAIHPIILVALGGAVGSVCRYKLSGFVLHQTLDWRFPLGTFLINVIGCLVIGILAGLILKFEMFFQKFFKKLKNKKLTKIHTFF